MIYKKEFYEDLSESVDALDYSSYTLQYPPPFIGINNFDNGTFVHSFQQSKIDACGIYIHIPFCETKCTFCRYFSIIDSQEETHNKYIEYLIKELSMYLSVMKNIAISSLYIGGGTPSALSEKNINTLLNFFFSNFQLTENFQFCFEANPSSVTFEKMKLLAKYKCHRFTLGIQSLDAEVLKKVNRRQSTKQVIQSIQWAKDVGIDFVNVDIMAGIKGQTMASFLKDLKIVIALNPDMIHIHPYTSTVRVIDEKIYTTDEKLSIQMAKIGNAILEKEGYLSIEGDANGKDINSRNKQLFEAMEGGAYIGVGVSAVGYNGIYRYINYDSIDEYFSSIAQGIFPIRFASFVSEKAKMIQYIIYTMRYGIISIPVFFSEFGKDITNEFSETLQILENEGVIVISDDKILFKYKTPKEYSIYSKYFYESSILENFALNKK